MGYMNEFPHSRMFDSDLREILEMYNTVKGLPNDWETFRNTMTADWSEMKNFVNTYFIELNVQNEINNKIDALVADGTMDALIRPIFESYNTELNLLKARVDNLAKLEAGSTTGDAELLDARVDKSGKTHANVGEHIREVTNKLSSEIAEIASSAEIEIGKNKFNKKDYEIGYITEDGSLLVSDNWLTSNYIDVTENKIITLSRTEGGERVLTPIYFIGLYDENKQFIKMESWGATSFTVTSDAQFIRFAFAEDWIDVQAEFGHSMTDYEEYKATYKFPCSGKEPLKWVGKSWVCIGDSLTEVNNRTTKHYYDYIAEETGISVNNQFGLGSTGYMKTQELNGGFYQREIYRLEQPDVLTIFGSGNDLTAGGANTYEEFLEVLGDINDSDTTTICGCINKCIDNYFGYFPTLQLGIVSPTPWVNNQPLTDSKMDKYCEKLELICKHRSIPYLDLYHSSNLRPWTEEGRNACYSKDEGNGVHPDENGHKLIASRFYGFLQSLII